MSISNFFYRLKQKWNYHTAKNDFERKVADINRNQIRIIQKRHHFKIAGENLEFNRKIYGFIIDRFDLFIQLIKSHDSKIIIDNNDLYFKTGDLTLKITTAEEIFIIYEIFVKRCYEVIIENDFNVIDVGMNVGFASLFFAQNKKIKKIYGYEPFKPTFNAALVNFELNKKYAQKIIPENLGLGSKNESLTVNYNDILKGKNSISNPGFEHMELIHLKCGKELIESILKKNPSERCLVKMDCEGSEFEIFENYNNKLMPEQLFGFIIEWHFRNPQFIIDILIRNHFKIHNTHNGKLGLITAFR